MSEVRVKLGDIARLQAGFGFPPDLQGRADGDYPFAKVGDISRCGRSKSSILSTADHYVDQSDVERLRAKLVPAGSILFAKIGEAIRQNHRVIAGCSMLIDNNAMAAVPGDKVSGRYLYHYLKTVDFYSLAPATTVPALRKSELEQLSIPLPSLPEQRRIAAILDQAETLRTQRRAALTHLDRLTQSIFLDMFGDPVKNPKNWPKLAFSQVCETRLGKMLDAKQQTGENKRCYLRNANVQWFRIDLFDLFEMDFDADARDIFRLEKGDILICEGGEPGRAAIWRGELEEVYYQKALHRGRPRAGVANPEYLVWLLWFLSKRGGLGDHITSATIAHLTGEKLKAMAIPVPPLPLQRAFATRAQAIEALKAKHRASLAQLDALFASLQHRAFNGELTAQAPALPKPRSFAELGQLNTSKGLEALVYAAKRLPNKGHYWPLKVQYVADRRHLESRGRSLYGETHVAMPYGPVPQAAFNASRALANGELICEFPMDAVRTALRRDGETLVALRDADYGVLSADERDSLDWAIRLVADMSFEELKTQTHDSAWEKTPRNAPMAWQDIIESLTPAVRQRLLEQFE